MDCAFNEKEQQCIVLLNRQLVGKTTKLQNPYAPDSLAFAAWVMARLAGWSGRPMPRIQKPKAARTY